MYSQVKYIPAGDISLIMEFGNSIDPEINSKIRNMISLLEKNPINSIREMVSTYRSIMFIYDPLKTSYSDLVDQLKKIGEKIGQNEEAEARIVELPTVYGGEYGPDIEFVAEHNNISLEEVIEIHSSTDYLLYMLGFTPGFGYLGGMSEKIETPRLLEPRTIIPAGSTGIAGMQTGIYPIDSPGGWQLIGRTPVKLYDPLGDPPVLLNAGDRVRFVPIDEEEYLKILDQVEKGSYQVKITSGGGDNGRN